jgi:hypothetical protein
MWTMVEHCVVRTTGFPVDLVARLRLPDVTGLAGKVLAAEREIASLVNDAERLPKILGRLTSPKGIKDERAEQYRSAFEELDSVVTRGTTETRAWLADFTRDPRVREVLAVTNPGLLRDLDRGRLTNRLTHQVASYVQRVCVKNETMSFFGPINFGRLDSGGPDRLELDWPGPDVLTDRRPTLSADITARIVDAVAFAEPIWHWLVLWPVVGLPGPRPSEELWHQLDGRTTLGVHAREVSEAVETARALVRRGLARHQLQPPSTSTEPLEFLLCRLSGVPGSAHMVRQLADLLSSVRDFGPADADGKALLQRSMPEKVETLCGASSWRSHSRSGQFYTDRLPLREECMGAMQLVISGKHATGLLDTMAPALDLLARFAAHRRESARAVLGKRLGVRRVPYWKLAALAADWPQPEDEDLRTTLLPYADRSEVDLADLELPGPVDPGSAVCSADVMIEAGSLGHWRDGTYQVVLGDVHDTALLTDWALRVHPNAEAVRTEVARLTAGAWGDVPVVSLLAGRRTGIPPLDLPGPVVELGGASGQPNPWRVDLDDLMVESDGQQARLTSSSLGSEVLLHNGELDTLAQTAFGALRLQPLRLRLGPYTPQLRCGQVILQRRTWIVPATAFSELPAQDPAKLLAATRLWQRYQLPGEVFVKLPGVRKPVYATVDSPMLLGALTRLAVRTEGDAVVSEVRPGLDQLWLAGPGGRHTAELRCVLVRRESP